MEVFTEEEARKITDRIINGTTVIGDLIAEAYLRRAWAVLGYDSWDAYVSGEFPDTPLALPREKRKEVVESLRGRGLSLRAIAAATGTNHQTVANDLAAVKAEAEAAAPEQVPTGGVEELDTSQAARLTELLEVQGERPLKDEENEELVTLEAIASGESMEYVDAEIVEEEPAKVVGIDGKSYSAPKEKPEKAPRPTTPEYLKTARKAAKLLQNAQELLSDVYTDKEYIDATKEAKTAVDEVLACPVNDLLDELSIKAPAKWLKLVQ